MDGSDGLTRGEIDDIPRVVADDVPRDLRVQIALTATGDSSGEVIVELRSDPNVRWFRTAARGPELLVQVADAVQDFVCDESGRPWPDVIDPVGEFVEVLEPRLQNGRPCGW